MKLQLDHESLDVLPMFVVGSHSVPNSLPAIMKHNHTMTFHTCSTPLVVIRKNFLLLHACTFATRCCQLKQVRLLKGLPHTDELRRSTSLETRPRASDQGRERTTACGVHVKAYRARKSFLAFRMMGCMCVWYDSSTFPSSKAHWRCSTLYLRSADDRSCIYGKRKACWCMSRLLNFQAKFEFSHCHNPSQTSQQEQATR